MNKYYVTMGQAHVHSIQGETVDKDSVVEIEAEDYNTAYDFAYGLFGTKFCTVNAEPHLEYYPRGIVLSLHAPTSPEDAGTQTSNSQSTVAQPPNAQHNK